MALNTQECKISLERKALCTCCLVCKEGHNVSSAYHHFVSQVKGFVSCFLAPSRKQNRLRFWKLMYIITVCLLAFSEVSGSHGFPSLMCMNLWVYLQIRS